MSRLENNENWCVYMNLSNSLFLRQSYIDAWTDYRRSLAQSDFPKWDYIILTASNEAQAEAYRQQLDARRKKKMLPHGTTYAVLPDPEGKRVGSGGATLNVLRYIREHEMSFQGKRMLCIHSGGDSKRVPQYSACGKLFSPVPRELPNGKRSTLFDEFLIGMSGVPSRIREGMLVLSGDVLLLFNPLQIDVPSSGAAAISFKEDVQVGKDHGVFYMDEIGNVGEFLHKQTVETLTKRGAVNERGKVDIDTGAVLFSTDLLETLYSLADTPDKFAFIVNERVRLSFYGDFLYPLASEATLEQFYREKPEGSLTSELRNCRTMLWEALSPYRMRLLRLSPAAFIHFGTTKELRSLMTREVEHYTFLDWRKNISGSRNGNYAVNNAVIDGAATIGDDCYLEDSYISGSSRIGAGSVLSHVTVKDQNIPSEIVLHGLKLRDGKFVTRLYAVEDNPKERIFLGKPLERMGGWNSLWEAELYPVCGTIEESVDAALNLYEITHGRGDYSAWERAERMSLNTSFNAADTAAILEWETHLRKTVKVENFLRIIRCNGTVSEAVGVFRNATLNAYQLRLIEEKLTQAASAVRMRTYYALGKVLENESRGEVYIRKAFQEIRNMVLSAGVRERFEDNRRRREEVTVRLPLRVNWGGGWSDTPPYCNEHGGTVLNAAILLNGKYPVEVCVKHLERPVILLESTDTGARDEFTDVGALQGCANPFDSFALHKAALLACGIVPREGGDLVQLLNRCGGLYLSTQVHGVPKGSGLGTSSILAGACVKALYEYFSIPYTGEELYDRVMCMEQMMSTGGGWQDQVGGMAPGIKMITSQPGAQQKLSIRPVELSKATHAELNERFALIYTGQRRLARNLLRDVIGRYIGGEVKTTGALEEIQRVAALMVFELERGNIDGFAALLNRHWELSQQIDEGTTNTCIDQIFLAVEDLIDGKMICGAGGGGFLQVILKKGISKKQLQERLREIFQDSGVDCWDCTLV